MKTTPPFARRAANRNVFHATVAVWLVASSAGLAAGDPKASSLLPRSSPEEQGIASSAILSFVDAADEGIDSLHSLMVVRHGHVVAEGWWAPYDAKTPHSFFSLTKSFTSTAVGLAVAEGKIKVDDRVLAYFPEDGPADPSDHLKAMRVRDLLTMSTGHHSEAPQRPDQPLPWTKAFLEQPVAHKPGTFFLYNTPASNMLSAILQQATGSTLRDYLRPRLFEPLGIETPIWDSNPQGVTIGGYGIKARTEDIARFGQLYLQKGEWRGRRLLPAAWVLEATSRQVSNGSNPESDWDQGYGYQFWRSRHNSFRGDGAFGQFCLVMPEQDAVVAITSGVKSMQAVMNLVWDRLLPAMNGKRLPANPNARKQLETRLAGLRLAPQEETAPSNRAKDISGTRYALPASDQKIDTLTLELGERGAVSLVAQSGGAEQRIACGRGEWRKQRLAHAGLPEQPVAASGGWTAEDTYVAKLWFYETPFRLILTLQFNGDELRYDAEWNVAFGPTKLPQLVGRAQPAKAARLE